MGESAWLDWELIACHPGQCFTAPSSSHSHSCFFPVRRLLKQLCKPMLDIDLLLYFSNERVMQPVSMSTSSTSNWHFSNSLLVPLANKILTLRERLHRNKWKWSTLRKPGSLACAHRARRCGKTRQQKERNEGWDLHPLSLRKRHDFDYEEYLPVATTCRDWRDVCVVIHNRRSLFPYPVSEVHWFP